VHGLGPPSDDRRALLPDCSPRHLVLSLCLEPRCNCDPARAAILRGEAWPKPVLGPGPPKWRPGLLEPRGPRLPCLLPFFPFPADFAWFLPGSLVCSCQTHSISLSLLLLVCCFSCPFPFWHLITALSVAFTWKSQVQRSKLGLDRNLGKRTRSLWSPLRRGGVATRSISA
jgi:hypothetical protein